jgi:hypothetical protein
VAEFFSGEKGAYRPPLSVYLAANDLSLTEDEVMALTRTPAPLGRFRLQAVSPRPSDPYKPRIQQQSVDRERRRRDLFALYGEHPSCGFFQAAKVLGVTQAYIQQLCSPTGPTHDIHRIDRALDGGAGVDIESLRYEWERCRAERTGKRRPPYWPRHGAFGVWAF